LFIFKSIRENSLRSVPWPLNTLDFGYSTARQIATSACTAIAKVHPFAEIPSSFIQLVKELFLIKFILLLYGTASLSCYFFALYRFYTELVEVFVEVSSKK